jgi:hypothetical protein
MGSLQLRAKAHRLPKGDTDFPAMHIPLMNSEATPIAHPDLFNRMKSRAKERTILSGRSR